MQDVFDRFEKSAGYLVCVDSDGCAMDTMETKHRQCFATELVREWGLEGREGEARELWYRINLYSRTRGINRFKGLGMALGTLEGQGVPALGAAEIADWARRAPELSNPALEREARRTGSAALKKALAWSEAVNRAIAGMPPDDKPFPGVARALEEMGRCADIAVVSSANGGALENEWGRHGLGAHVRLLLGQEAGSKAHCIARLMEKGYGAGHVLMVGDAPGDLDAARKNGVPFYPILVGKEGFSWSRLREEAFERLLRGRFTPDYQAKLVQEFEQNLGPV